MAVTCTETIAPAQAISFGEATGEGVQREANSEDSAPAAQERMPPSMSLALVYVPIVLLVLNTEIVVPTADDYAKRLGASESFSGLVIALTPFWQGILGVPLNYAMLRCGISIKSMIIIMAAGSVAGNVLYALAGLMQFKCTILISRAMIGICQCQLAGPIYIARSVGVKRRTKVMFVFSSLTGVALCGAPLIASLLEIFVKELRIGDLLLNSDTMPGWFMAVVYFIYMLLIVFCFEDSSRDETSLSPNLLEEGESCWKPGLWVCLFASFLSTTTKTMCVVFFVKLSEQTWGLSISSTGFALAGAMALVTAGSFANSAVTTYVEDRRGLLIGCLCAAISAVLTFHFGDSWNTTSTIIFMLGFLLMQSFFCVVKNYGYALVPKIVPPQWKDRTTTANSVALQLGRGLGAQLGAVMSITGFAASQVLSYFLLAGLVAVFSKELRQHEKAM
ncbi:unnamed protein product [Durusdinium trenchii]|uniref:Solute carrier family 40 protein n=2 Tax=Durusdinium trenchii TaxID=1381693 RepID=A0ABP0J969_9DINO